MCTAADKRAWCTGPHCVLIDDRATTHEPSWVANEGVFVHFGAAGAVGAIWQLKRLFDPSGYNAAEVAAAQRVLARLQQAEESQPRKRVVATVDNIVLVQGDAAGDSALRAFVDALRTSEDDPQQRRVGNGEEERGPPTVVGVDVEWRPDEQLAHRSGRRKSAAAVLQLAAANGQPVLIVDLLALSEQGSQCVHELMTASSVLKLFFGTEEDSARLAPALTAAASVAAAAAGRRADAHANMISPVLDLQEALPQLLSLAHNASGSSKQKWSLDDAARLVLGRSLAGKSKAMQTSDWEQRPLTEAQLRYAGEDAAILVDIFCTLTGPIGAYSVDGSRSGGGGARAGASADGDSDGDGAHDCRVLRGAFSAMVTSLPQPSAKMRQRYVLSSRARGGGLTTKSSSAHTTEEAVNGATELPRVDIACVRLTPDSVEKLLKAFPARCDTVHADHVTLAYRPAPPDVPAYISALTPCLGRHVRLRVMQEMCDRTQAGR